MGSHTLGANSALSALQIHQEPPSILNQTFNWGKKKKKDNRTSTTKITGL